MSALKKLASDTAIYGVSSIVGRIMNWLLMPLYTNLFLPEIYSDVVKIYSYVGFLLVMLTYGMETGFFRFASQSKEKPKVYGTTLTALGSTSLLFITIIALFYQQISSWIDLSNHPEYILMMGITVGLDAFMTIPFANLRVEKRPKRFALIKLVNIGLIIGFNLFFLIACPLLSKYINIPFYQPSYGIGYIFISNLLATCITTLMLIPHMTAFRFDRVLLKKMIAYSFPILIVGITGMINQNIDKVLMTELIPQEQNPEYQLGIYGACFKLAVLMNMFIQAFRYAFEPFFFSNKKDGDDKQTYVLVMKYFTIFSCFIFLGISMFVDLFPRIGLIDEAYISGLSVVPIVTLANLFMGVYFNLSLWYKLTDNTRFGGYFGIIGSVVTILLNFVLVPRIGFYGSAIAMLACFIVMVICSYFMGNKYYKINYDLKSFFFYIGSSIALFIVYWSQRTNEEPQFLLAIGLFLLFTLTVFLKEKKAINKVMNNKSIKMD